MELSSLNDRWYIVCPAYIAAFLPWTAFAAKDFISDEWKTVRHTRIAGYINLYCSIIPAIYILFYCAVQFSAKDHKEGSAAVIALMFALLHGARSSWGLWQLHIFRLWCANSIDALRQMGVAFRFSDKERRDFFKNEKRAWVLSDDIVVNSSIVDNQLFNGDVKSYVRYGDSVDLRAPTSLRRVTCLEAVSLVWRYLAVWGKALMCMCVMMMDGMRFVVGFKTSGKFQQVLKEPEEVWVNWAISFSAQGLGRWIKDFSVSMNPRVGERGGKREESLENWRRRALYFASEVLSTSIMQIWPELEGERGDDGGARGPMVWSGWEEGSMMHSGRVVKKELLEQAMQSGEGLPFGVTHDRLLREEKEWDGEKGYSAFSRQLASKVGRLDVRKEFCSEIVKLDVNMMEWLTILLYLGSRSMKAERDAIQGEYCEDKEGMKPVEEFRDSGVIEGGNDKTGNDDERIDQALMNLRHQLSFPLKAKAKGNVDERENVTEGTAVQPSFPFSTRWRHGRSRNRHVLKVGQIVHIWMALVAGDGLQFMLTLNEQLARMFTIRSLNGMGEDNGDGPSNNEVEATDDHGETEEASQVHMGDFQRSLEKDRLRYQFGDENCICEWGMNFGMTFMGYRMETVRSYLAEWVYRMKGTMDSSEGVSKLKSRFRSCVEGGQESGGGGVRRRIFLSNAFCGSFEYGEVSATIRSRQFHIRLLWELQEHFESKIESWMGCEEDEDEDEVSTHGPESFDLIALCLLSFPSIRVEVQQKKIEDFVTKGREWCGIQIERCSEKTTDARTTKHVVAEIEIVIEPVCGPQHSEMKIRFDLDEAGTGIMAVVSVWVENGEEFVWEWWRDAFTGRLEGMKEWQEEHYMECPLGVVRSSGHMNTEFEWYKTVTKERFEVWSGWKPFRTDICMFELKHNSLLKRNRRLRGVERLHVDMGHGGWIFSFSKQTRSRVSYEKAKSSVVLHAMSMIRDSIYEDSRINETEPGAGFEDDVDREEKLVANAKKLSRGDGADVERALLLYETAVGALGNADALEEGVEFILGHDRIPDERATELVHKFVSYIAPSGELSESKMETGAYDILRNVVLSTCEKIVLRCDLSGIDYRLYDTILFLSMHGDQIGQVEIRAWMEALLCRSESFGAMCNYAQLYGPIFGTKKTGSSTLQEKRVTERVKGLKTEIRSECTNESIDSQYMVRLLERTAIEGRDESRTRGMIMLANLLTEGKEVEVDAARAQGLYERAIEEGGHVRAMFNLGLLLHNGAKGVAMDAARAQRPYERAIEEGRDVGAMVKLGNLLENGPEGVAVDAARAQRLYERAIEEGGDVGAMVKLGNLLENGAEGVAVDAARAQWLYERAIEEGGDVLAMFNLAVLLRDGAKGVAVDAVRAQRLFAQVSALEGNCREEG